MASEPRPTDAAEVTGVLLEDGSVRLPSLSSGRRFAIRLRPAAVRQVRLVGLNFDREKSFILPRAMSAIRRVREIYSGQPGAKLLVVGHTDSSGSKAYNRTLSLERARAVAAYLTDDVESWLAFYDHNDGDRRWGEREDTLMLKTLPAGAPYFSSGGTFTGAVEKCQEKHGLVVDGKCGPKTRRALVTEYMGVDGTTLPEGFALTVHGCGEDFPREDSGGGGGDERNRRVELFSFSDFINPAPSGETSTSSDGLYAAWLASVDETIDLTDRVPDRVRIRLCDHTGSPMGKTAFCAFFGKRPSETGFTDGSGYAEVTPPPVCPEKLSIAWGADSPDGEFEYAREIFVECDGGGEQGAMLMLTNLGFPAEHDPELAVRRFQRVFKVDHEPEPLGLVNGKVPDGTRKRIEREFRR